MKVTPPDSPDLPSRLNNLAIGLRDRFEHTRREADLDEAIRVLQRAVKATPPDSPNLPEYLNNLGTGLRDRFACVRCETDLDEAASSRSAPSPVHANRSRRPVPKLLRYSGRLGESGGVTFAAC